MSAITYGIVEEKYILGNTERISYGIVACADTDEEGIACVVASVQDLSSDRARLEHLAMLCNQLELDPDHLTDIAEDFL